MVFIESGLKINIPDSYNPYKADKKTYNGLSSVDFIAETPNEFLFIEVKNIDNHSIPKEHIEEQKKKMLNKTKPQDCKGCELHKNCPKCSRIEFVCEISANFKDSILKELAKGKQFSKPIVCVLLLEFSDFAAKYRRTLYKNINERMPKFSEDEYYNIHSIKLDLCDKDLIMQKYNGINVDIAELVKI